MLIAVPGGKDPVHDTALQAMFEERKRVFVDLLKWDVPVLAGRYEVDQFDDQDATYLIILDDNNEHAASARLLRTDRPHILDSIFPDLCADVPPTGPSIREITRFCLSRRLSTKERRHARNRLLSAFADYALLTGITAYTGVAEMAWLQQLLAFGWDCRPLGLPRAHGARLLSALKITITPETPRLLRAGGVYAPSPQHAVSLREVA